MQAERKSPTRIAVILVALAASLFLALGPPWMVSSDATADADPAQALARQRALAVFVLCLALWLTHAIPLAITGLLAFALLPLLGVAEERVVLGHLGNSAVFFMLGVFFLVASEACGKP